MSPRVTLTISAEQIAELRRTPRVHLLEAVAAARGRGLRMRCGELGVVAGLTEWRVDRALRAQGVSLAGAVLLRLQPEVVEGEEPLAAAARALDVSLAWMTGAEAAWCRELMSCEWLARPDADLYLAGYELAAEVRLAFEGAW
jgi:hypothetical protein